VCLAVRLKSGEALIGTSERFAKARDFRDEPGRGGRWSARGLDKFVGVPWEPHPGAKGGSKLQSRVRLSVDPAEFTETVKCKGEHTKRRFRFEKEDL
jgi:hypothetical protein